MDTQAHTSRLKLLADITERVHLAAEQTDQLVWYWPVGKDETADDKRLAEVIDKARFDAWKTLRSLENARIALEQAAGLRDADGQWITR